MEQRGWVASHRSSPGLPCCKPEGRDILFYCTFLASWLLTEVVGEDGKKKNRLQY